MARAVAGERGTGRGGDAEPLHQGLRTVMARADRNALAVEDGGDIVWMNTVEHEGKNTRLGVRGADQPKTPDLGERADAVGEDFMLVGCKCVVFQPGEEVDGRAETDGASHVGRAGLELVGGLL